MYIVIGRYIHFLTIKVFWADLVSAPQVSEMAVSELPGNPNAVWTVRRHVEGKQVSDTLSNLTQCQLTGRFLLLHHATRLKLPAAAPILYLILALSHGAGDEGPTVTQIASKCG